MIRTKQHVAEKSRNFAKKLRTLLIVGILDPSLGFLRGRLSISANLKRGMTIRN